jgi:hypothetical protein
MRIALYQRAIVICFLSLFAASAVYSVAEQPKLNHDGAVYIILSQSLVSGEGYRNLYVVDSPPHTKFPPIFPLLLASIVYLFDLNFWAMKLFVVMIGTVALYAVYLFFRRMAGNRVALIILVSAGVSHGVWFYSRSILSEIPYLLFSFVSLYLLESYKEERARILSKAWITALTIGIASLTRTIGLALLVGGVAYIALERGKSSPFDLRRRLTKSGLLALLACAPVALWFLRNWVVSVGTTPVAYLQEYGLKDYASIDSKMTGLNDLYELIYHNVYIYLIGSSKIIIPYFSWFSLPIVNILITTITLVGFFICLIKKRTILEYYVIPYVMALLLFPVPYSRYLVPLIPIISYYFFVALREAVHLVFFRHQLFVKQEVFGSVSMIFAVLAICTNFTLLTLDSIPNRGHNNNYSYREDEDENMYESILPWVKANTTPQNIFIWSKPALRYLLAQRKSAPLLTTTDTKRVLASLEDTRVEYVVVDSFSDRTLRYLKPIIEKHPNRFSLVYHNVTSAIYRVVR